MPEPERYFKAGDRIEYRVMYAVHKNDAMKGVRGTVIEDAVLSIMTGVLVRWDNGVKDVVVSGFQARKLNLLERIGEV